MTRNALLLAVLALGCGGRVLDESGAGNGELSGSGSEQSDAGSTPAPIDTGTTSAKDSAPVPVVDSAPPPPVIAPSEVWYIEVDESAAAVPRKIRVNSKCIVTDNTGLNTMGDASRCAELFKIAVDPTRSDCGPGGAVGTVVIRLHDGRELVRDLSADRCSVVIPSIPTHKHVYAVWYSAGGK
jgi:hypothetical protein